MPESLETLNSLPRTQTSLSMKMCAQRKAGGRERSGRSCFQDGTRVLADEYAIFKVSPAMFIFRIWSKSFPINIVCMKSKLFSPNTLDSSIITT